MGVEELFKKFKGVISTEVGYAGGEFKNPAYTDVTTGQTGHAEVIYLIYDKEVTSLDKIYDYFFRLHDPTTRNRQGNDMGTQYRSIIFY